LDALCENWFQAKAKQAQAEWLAIQAQSQLFQEEEIELVENHYSLKFLNLSTNQIVL